jgi:hypothetical protein
LNDKNGEQNMSKQKARAQPFSATAHSDKILSTISDQAISDAVVTAATQTGVRLSSNTLKRVVAAVREALRDMIAEHQSEAALRAVIERQTKQFMLRCGLRPKIL